MEEPPSGARWDSWLVKAADLLEELDKAPDDTARAKVIDDNSEFWGRLKPWLLERSHQKCWFSEAKDCFSHWDVEHFRPKKAARSESGEVDAGYWWLAFDWRNLRICGNVGNRKKGTHFPVRAGTSRTDRTGDLREEEYLLLDPADEDDPSLLFFNFLGEAVPAPYVKGEWERYRVEYSVERYRLDFDPLVQKRRVVWSECWRAIEEYRTELQRYSEDPTKMVAKDRYKQAAQRLRKMIRDDVEMSSVARACIISAGDERLRGLLQSS